MSGEPALVNAVSLSAHVQKPGISHSRHQPPAPRTRMGKNGDTIELERMRTVKPEHFLVRLVAADQKRAALGSRLEYLMFACFCKTLQMNW